MTRLVLAVVLLWCAIAASCGRVTGERDVVGTYRMNQGKAHDEVVIRADGSYRHSYRAPGGVELVEGGGWELARDDGRLTIEFERFAHHSRTEFFPGERIIRGWWIVRPERTWKGQVRLPVDPDINLYYVRTRGVSAGDREERGAPRGTSRTP